MLARAHTFTIEGLQTRHVIVEVDIRPGLPGFAIVGLTDAAVARERQRGSIDVGAMESCVRCVSDLLRMRWVSWLFVLTLVALLCLEAPATARVSASDVAATHDYLEARIALRRAAAVAGKQAELKTISVLEVQVKAECPGVLAGAPPHVKGEKTNQSELEVSEELLSGTFGAAERLAHPAYARFARTVRRLHWSNPRLTRLLRSLAIEQTEQSAIPPPELCSDLKFWVASGYTAVSVGTKRFLHRLSVVSSITQIESEPHEPVADFFNLNALVAHRLKPYEDGADHLLARKALPPDAKLTNPALRPFLEAVGKVYVALGRSAAPAA